MAADLARLEQLIAESEQRITEQVFCIMAAEAKGRDTTLLRRSLRGFESILVEFHRARKLIADAQQLAGSGPDASGLKREAALTAATACRF